MKAVIFDLDGTLVHSSPDIALHLNNALESVYGKGGTLANHDIEMLIGGGMLELINKGVEALGHTPDPDGSAQILDIYRDAYNASPVIKTELYDGVVGMLDALAEQGIKIGLCTNKPEFTARRVLDHFDLTPRFEAIIGGDTTDTRKPEAAPLLEACRQLGITPQQGVMVGDSKADFGAARGAEMKIILVDWGYSSITIHELGGDAVISSYDEFDRIVLDLLAA